MWIALKRQEQVNPTFIVDTFAALSDRWFEITDHLRTSNFVFIGPWFFGVHDFYRSMISAV